MTVLRTVARVSVIAAVALSAAACATTTKVAVQQPGDASMSCAQLKAEFAKLDAVQQEADHNKGVNTANVAAVLLFWPAAVGNYMDADKAEELVTQRKSVLANMYAKKNCSN